MSAIGATAEITQPRMSACRSSDTRCTSPSRLQITTSENAYRRGTTCERDIRNGVDLASRRRTRRGCNPRTGCSGQATNLCCHCNSKNNRCGSLQTPSRKGAGSSRGSGGHYLIRTGNISSLDGTPPASLALIKFESVEKAQAWYNSAAEKEVDVIRAKSTESLAFIVEGIAK
jgi:uncharacterized protein (DUF1330 family)